MLAVKMRQVLQGFECVIYEENAVINTYILLVCHYPGRAFLQGIRRKKIAVKVGALEAEKK